jgi:hypothetical protein
MSSNYEIDSKIISKLKSFDWDFIIDFGFNKVNHIKGNQYNFWRGTLMEQIVALQDTKLKFVGGDTHHKDFDWERFGVTLELKSLLTKEMYTRRGALKTNFKLNLTNLRSTRELKESEICDIILVIMKDGAFIIPKQIAFQNRIQNGKKVDIIVPSKYIIEISGRKSLSLVNQKVDINEMIRDFSKHTIELAKEDFISRQKLKV